MWRWMDARIVSSRADAARKMLLEMRSLVMEKDQECQKLKGWHPGTSRKRKYASSLSDVSISFQIYGSQ